MPLTFPLDVRWSTDNQIKRARISDPDQGLALFHEVSAESRDAPTMVEFADDDRGLAFAIGAGRPVTVLTAQRSLDPPYFTSMARDEAAADTWFRYAGENTPYPGISVIRLDAGINALVHFLNTGELDSNVEWEKL